MKTFYEYVQGLPNWLKADDNFVKHYEQYYNLLLQVSEADDMIIELLDIFNPTIKQVYAKLDYMNVSDVNIYAKYNDVLDKLLAFYGIPNPYPISASENQFLNNNLKLIVIKNYIMKCAGISKREDLTKFYNDLYLDVAFKTEAACRVVVICRPLISCMSVEDYAVLVKLIQQSDFLIRSMGVTYRFDIAMNSTTAGWNMPNIGRTKWDNQRWA